MLCLHKTVKFRAQHKINNDTRVLTALTLTVSLYTAPAMAELRLHNEQHAIVKQTL